ncbi:unnamed protein product, partial [Prorocentrum cordatum]
MALTAGILALLAFAPQVSGMLDVRHGEESCASQDLGHRAQLQNKLAGVCEAMCKEVEAYPKCNCPNFVEPDSTPGVMTWEELLSHMDQLAEWGRDSIKGWHKQAAQLQVSGVLKATHGEESCAAQDLAHRAQVQNKLAGVCEAMCKEVEAYPQCNCPNFVEPDSTPGVMTWEELLSHMDQLADWGRDSIKGWHKQAAQLQVSGVLKATHGEESCAAQDLAHRAQVQNKLAGVCETMCKEVEAYPKCNCPNFVEPDSTPGVMTWEELLSHMDQLADWGRDSIKGWHKQAAQLQVSGVLKATHGEESCAAQDLAQRAQLQNKLAGVCETMCKEVEAYPQCNCPNFVEPDSTPGVMTWEELLSHMDQLADWGRDSIKGWHKQASQLQVMQGNGTSTNGTKNTSAKANDACTAKVVGTAPVSLADGGMPHMVYDHVEFCGKGQLKSVAGACQHQEAFDDGPG